MGVCTGHAGWVGSIDWSESGSSLQSNGPNGELLYWDVRTCAALEPSAAALCTWSTASCPHQWAMMGIGGLVGGSPRMLSASRRSHAGGAVAVAARDGSITLVGYPCVGSAAASRRYAELRDSVDSLAWSADDGVLLSMSASGELFQWVHIGAEPSDHGVSAAAAAAVEEAAYDSDIEHELVAPSAPGDTRDAESAELAATVKTGWATTRLSGSSAGVDRALAASYELHAPLTGATRGLVRRAARRA